MDIELKETLNIIINKLGELDAGQKELKQDFEGLKQDFEGLNQDFAELKQGQNNIMIILENEIRPSIQTIAEGHTILNSKLDKLGDRADRTEDKTDNLDIRVIALEVNAGLQK